MSWIYLIIAGFLEVVWAGALGAARNGMGFGLFLLVAGPLVASMWLLKLALHSLPLGVAYPVWTGIGSLGAFALGVLVLGEGFSMMRLAGILMILGGIGVLKLS